MSSHPDWGQALLRASVERPGEHVLIEGGIEEEDIFLRENTGLDSDLIIGELSAIEIQSGNESNEFGNDFGKSGSSSESTENSVEKTSNSQITSNLIKNINRDSKQSGNTVSKRSVSVRDINKVKDSKSDKSSDSNVGNNLMNNPSSCSATGMQTNHANQTTGNAVNSSDHVGTNNSPITRGNQVNQNSTDSIPPPLLLPPRPKCRCTTSVLKVLIGLVPLLLFLKIGCGLVSTIFADLAVFSSGWWTFFSNEFRNPHCIRPLYCLSLFAIFSNYLTFIIQFREDGGRVWSSIFQRTCEGYYPKARFKNGFDHNIKMTSITDIINENSGNVNDLPPRTWSSRPMPSLGGNDLRTSNHATTSSTSYSDATSSPTTYRLPSGTPVDPRNIEVYEEKCSIFTQIGDYVLVISLLNFIVICFLASILERRFSERLERYGGDVEMIFIERNQRGNQFFSNDVVFESEQEDEFGGSSGVDGFGRVGAGAGLDRSGTTTGGGGLGGLGGSSFAGPRGSGYLDSPVINSSTRGRSVSPVTVIHGNVVSNPADSGNQAIRQVSSNQRTGGLSRSSNPQNSIGSGNIDESGVEPSTSGNAGGITATFTTGPWQPFQGTSFSLGEKNGHSGHDITLTNRFSKNEIQTNKLSESGVESGGVKSGNDRGETTSQNKNGASNSNNTASGGVLASLPGVSPMNPINDPFLKKGTQLSPSTTKGSVGRESKESTN